MRRVPVRQALEDEAGCASSDQHAGGTQSFAEGLLGRLYTQSESEAMQVDTLLKLSDFVIRRRMYLQFAHTWASRGTG